MKRVLTAVVLIPLVLLAVFRAPWWLFTPLLIAVIILSEHEYLTIARAYGLKPLHWAAYLGCIVAGLASALPLLMGYVSAMGEVFSWTIFLLPFLFFGVLVVFRRDMQMALPAAAVSGFGIVYVALPLGLLGSLRERCSVAVVFVLFSVWAGDTAAYYCGKNLGRHKLAPAVSPNKTWEGAIASVLASIAVTALVCRFRQPISHWFGTSIVSIDAGPLRLQAPASIPWLQVLIVGALTNLAAQLGDLFESAMKRGANLKDSGTLVPGHGGILDRIDALLFAIPVVYLYVAVSFYLRQSLFCS